MLDNGGATVAWVRSPNIKHRSMMAVVGFGRKTGKTLDGCATQPKSKTVPPSQKVVLQTGFTYYYTSS